MRFTGYFYWHVQTRPDVVCMEDEERRITYAEADRLSNRIANSLAPYERQARVALLADASVTVLLLDLGITKANCVMVPLNTRLSPAEWKHIVEHSGAQVVIVGENYCSAIEAVSGQLPGVRRWVSIGKSARAGWESLDELIESAPDGPGMYPACGDDIALQAYTSGTTGLPKGVLCSHDAQTFRLVQFAQTVDACNGLHGEALIAAPLFHPLPLVMWRVVTCWGGAVQTLAKFDADAVLDIAASRHVSWTFVVPSMITMLLERAELRPETDYRFNVIMYGGSPITEPTLRAALERFKCNFIQVYGLTEVGLLSTLNPHDHVRALDGRPHLLRSAGKPTAGVQMRIAPIGHDAFPGVAAHDGLPSHTVGEIVASSPDCMLGYHNNPEATAAMLVDGEIHSGDAGYVDEEGYFYVADRLKDIVVSGGENIVSLEVEEVISRHDAVADVAVVAVPDPRWGEAVAAVVVVKPGHAVTDGELRQHCRAHIAAYKTPKLIEFRDRLPRNAMGKVLKAELRRELARG
jgi:acyl-CoA synthetase (AMP-forming)/AMP-acid ligase II